MATVPAALEATALAARVATVPAALEATAPAARVATVLAALEATVPAARAATGQEDALAAPVAIAAGNASGKVS
ncbi:hypothetical protein J21TS3_37870 [Paenibacillus cookii]|uniref:Uncharacterized protein n=1 Tax=Paenibacillus cookii TaxID=157839 RepID=A0ABQ4M0A3_9BACL|nr:hypothetical protein J21TS3_37870 [Paenibacillus cookii]